VVTEGGDDVELLDVPEFTPPITESSRSHGKPRHLALPGPGSFTRLWASVVTIWRNNRVGLLIAFIATVALRLITEWVALVSQYGTQFPHLVARKPDILLQVWAHWDVGYYQSIAQFGYAGKTIGHGQAADGIAFAPLYPWGIRLIHAITPLGWVGSAELLSAGFTFVSLAALHRVATLDSGLPAANSSVLLLLCFPTAFFLLAPYPESMALALTVLAFMAARRRHWLLAGLCAAGATLTKYYLIIIVVALAVEVWQARQDRKKEGVTGGTWEHELIRLAAVSVPSLAAMGVWMAYQQSHFGDAYAFVHAQERHWHRHFAAPWTLFHRTLSDMVHLRFLDTSTASVTELFDFVSVLILAVVALYTFFRIRRSYGVFLGLSWCVYTFETFLLSTTREVLVLFPLFIGVGVWASRRGWRERALLVLMIPCSYFLIQRFVTGAFAG
jgi:hypothetical protein